MEAIHRVFKDHPGLLHVAAGRVGALALGAIFWLIMARLLDPSAYGRVNWLISVAMFASVFCLLGLEKTVVTYYAKEGREGLVDEAVTAVFLTSLAAGVVMGLLIEPLVGLLAFSTSLFSMTISCELGGRRYRRCMWIWLGSWLATIPLGVGMYLWLGLLGLLLGYTLPTLAFALPSLRRLRLLHGHPSMGEVRSKAGFASKAFGTDVATSSTWLLDKILIGSVFGMAALGLYQLAYQVFMALSILPGILFSYLLPEKSAGAKTREVEVCTILASIALAVSAVLLSPWIIPWAFPKFAGSVALVQIMSLGLIPCTVAMARMSDLFAKERPGAVLTSCATALAVGIAGIVCLGSLLGTVGLAMGMLLLQTTLAISLTVLGRHCLSHHQRGRGIS